MKKILKILAVLLLALVLYFVNGFYGNPISKLLVTSAANKYIDKNYKDLDLEKEPVNYNFKMAAYTMTLQDKNSQDTNFQISFDGLGRFKSDSFNQRLFNTYIRFNKVLRDHGKMLENKEHFPYEINLMIRDDGNYEGKIQLDEEVDLNKFPFDVEAQTIGFSEKPTYEEALKIFKNLKQIMDKEPFSVSDYSLILIPEKDRAEGSEAKTWENALTIYDVTADLIEKESVKDLEEHSKKMDEIKK